MTTNPKAFALRPVRFKNNDFIHYEATTFPKQPYDGCDMYLRRLQAFGFIVADDDWSLGLDVLSKKGDILDTFPLTKDGFEYPNVRSTLQLRVQPLPTGR